MIRLAHKGSRISSSTFWYVLAPAFPTVLLKLTRPTAMLVILSTCWAWTRSEIATKAWLNG